MRLVKNWIDNLICPECGSRLQVQDGKFEDNGIWGVPGVSCVKCGSKYPVKSGILEMLPAGDYSKYEYWDNVYKDPENVIKLYSKRFSYNDRFLLNYYVMPTIAKKLGWFSVESVELGCGWGTNSLALKRFGLTKKIWLVDISPAALKGAMKVHSKFGSEVYPVRADIHKLPFCDNAFDVALSGGLYEHFVGKEQEELIKENCRICLKVLCQIPENNMTYRLYRAIYTFIKGKWPFGFETPVSRGKLSELFKAAGCDIKGWEYNNLATAVIIRMADSRPIFRKFALRPFFFRLFEHDAVIAADCRASAGKKGVEGVNYRTG